METKISWKAFKASTLYNYIKQGNFPPKREAVILKKLYGYAQKGEASVNDTLDESFVWAESAEKNIYWDEINRKCQKEQDKKELVGLPNRLKEFDYGVFDCQREAVIEIIRVLCKEINAVKRSVDKLKK